MRYCIIITCCILMLAGVPEWMAVTRWPLLSAVSYPLFHTNVFHLVVNMLAVWVLYSPERKGKGLLLLCSWLVSALVWPLAPHPVIGISNLLYASIGFMTPVLRKGYWKQPAVIAFYVMTSAMVLLPGVSGWAHVAALACGLAVSLFRMKS